MKSSTMRALWWLLGGLTGLIVGAFILGVLFKRQVSAEGGVWFALLPEPLDTIAAGFSGIYYRIVGESR